LVAVLCPLKDVGPRIIIMGTVITVVGAEVAVVAAAGWLSAHRLSRL
jgi:hypothetical protein